jgi:hypothetical protein
MSQPRQSSISDWSVKQPVRISLHTERQIELKQRIIEWRERRLGSSRDMTNFK